MRIVHTNPDTGIVRITKPIWFDYKRALREAGATLKQSVTDGWVYTHTITISPAEAPEDLVISDADAEAIAEGSSIITETTRLTEVSGELSVTEDDIQFSDGSTVFVLTRDEYFVIVIARLQLLGVLPLGTLGTAYHIVADADVPERIFRSAWVWTGAITTDMVKARSIHLTDIREVRNAELLKLDVPYIKALESGDTVEQRRVVGLKQMLRDIPQTLQATLDICTTPEELKAVWPRELQ